MSVPHSSARRLARRFHALQKGVGVGVGVGLGLGLGLGFGLGLGL